VYESFGDNGFWSALNDLTKRARSPVFLTCNSFPKGLSSASLRYRSMETCRPTPEECASWMDQLMQNEGISMQLNGGSDRTKYMASITELCGCDIRRILHELQLFAKCKGEPNAKTDDAANHASLTLDESGPRSDVRPVAVVEVSPEKVPSDDFSLIKVKGNNFCALITSSTSDESSNGWPVDVYVGDQICPSARIVDDETILAVCPPCRRPANVDEFGLRQHACSSRASLEIRFASLTIQSCRPSGGVSVSSTAIRIDTLLDESRFPVAAPCNIEYTFPEPPRVIKRQHSTSSDDEECEFESGDTSRSTYSFCCVSESAFLARRIDDFFQASDVADQLLQEGLKKIKDAVKGMMPMANKVTIHQTARDFENVLESLARDYELASDAILLDDHRGIPFLSGASPGFAYAFTPEGSAASASSTKLTRHGNSTE
jgi:hypothetical protein